MPLKEVNTRGSVANASRYSTLEPVMDQGPQGSKDPPFVAWRSSILLGIAANIRQRHKSGA